jgi:uncharacterized membrane protein
MKTIEESIIVDVPVNQVWTRFADFPHFMEGVKEVTQLDDKRLLWKAEVAGKSKEWDAEITDQILDQRIAWRSTSGAKNSGIINFSAQGPNQTEVNLEVEYEPKGMIENLGDLFGLMSARVRGDLGRFKDFIETKHTATGSGWNDPDDFHLQPVRIRRAGEDLSSECHGLLRTLCHQPRGTGS